MKKTTFLVVLLMASILSIKAQSPSDSAYACDFSYTYINTFTLPQTSTGDLSGCKILKDFQIGRRAKGYSIFISTTKMIDIYMRPNDEWDSYLLIIDANFNEITHNDDCDSGSRIQQLLTPGQYYILASEKEFSSDSRPFTITIDEIPQQRVTTAYENILEVYPNPATDVLNVNIESTIVNETEIIDIYGKPILHYPVNNTNNSLDISKLPIGMYYIRLKGNTGIKGVRKFLKR